MSKCGHCRRKISYPAKSFITVKAKDGSTLCACPCGKTWVKPAPAASAEYNLWWVKEAKRHAEKFNFDRSTKATRLRELAIQAYWAARTPTEAKMAGIIIDLFAPDAVASIEGVPDKRCGTCLIL